MSTAEHAELQRQLSDNLARIRGAIADAARRSGRGADAVRLVAVTKYARDEAVAALLELGVVDLGESRVQQLTERASRLGSAVSGEAAEPGLPHWHMIGHLQRNKIRALLPAARIVHSVDSVRLVRALAKEAAKQTCTVDVFLEVNVAGEASKSGAALSELDALADAAVAAEGVCMRGLMTMAPYVENAEQTRRYFAELRERLEALRAAGRVPAECDQLSMGMSNDFAVAVEEGATVVRLGSILYENTDADTRDPR